VKFLFGVGAQNGSSLGDGAGAKAARGRRTPKGVVGEVECADSGVPVKEAPSHRTPYSERKRRDGRSRSGGPWR